MTTYNLFPAPDCRRTTIFIEYLEFSNWFVTPTASVTVSIQPVEKTLVLTEVSIERLSCSFAAPTAMAVGSTYRPCLYVDKKIV